MAMADWHEGTLHAAFVVLDLLATPEVHNVTVDGSRGISFRLGTRYYAAQDVRFPDEESLRDVVNELFVKHADWEHTHAALPWMRELATAVTPQTQRFEFYAVLPGFPAAGGRRTHVRVNTFWPPRIDEPKLTIYKKMD